MTCLDNFTSRGRKRAEDHLPNLLTDAIFDPINPINAAADLAPEVLRVSMDAKATVKVGPFARGGKSRVPTTASDHDFKPVATVTPVGIFLPATDELFVYKVTSKVTSDCLADRLEQWWVAVHDRFAHITTLVINLDTGPENHSRRTQFMQRIVDFVRQSGLTIRLAYYLPYHSKYNPIERCWEHAQKGGGERWLSRYPGKSQKAAAHP